LQLEYPSKYLAKLVAEGQPYDSATIFGRKYSFNGTVYVDSPRIAATWLETPPDEPIGTYLNGDTAIGRSSAYLNVQIPYPLGNSTANSTAGFFAACSVDARWVQSSILGSRVAQNAPFINYQEIVYEAPSSESFTLHDPGVFPAVDDGNWRTVRLGIDWLKTLTPELAEFSNWNTLSSTLTDIGLDNKTGLIPSSDIIQFVIEGLVSTIVVDGMSRSGYERNGGVGNVTGTSWPLEHWPGAESYGPILAGSYVLPFGYDDDGSATDRTKVRWSVAVTGLGYRADSVTYYLALAVLFLHVALAMCHIVWVFTTCLSKVCERETSTAWGSLTELITLALKSTPPDTVLDNASAGIERFRTFKEPVRIRTTLTQGPNGGADPQTATMQGAESVEMIVGTKDLLKAHKLVVIGQSY
jgi:hypothetical protein